MTVDVFKVVAATVENWAATSNFTGQVYHMVNSYERWLDCARLPFSNIGDHLDNGGFGSITTIHSANDTISHNAGEYNPDGSSFWNETITNITTGEKAHNGGHTWHKLTKNGTGNVRAVRIINYIETTNDVVNIGGVDIPFKQMINDGNGIYDDEMPESTNFESDPGISGYLAAGVKGRGPAPS